MIHSSRAATIALASAAALTLSACAGGSASAPPARPTAGVPPRTGERPATNLHRTPVVPTARGSASGLAGADAASLTASFGTPRIDVNDGPARKLQWVGQSCVLDAYLYPQREGATPTVTHADARTREGADADVASCVAALRRR